MNKIEKQATNLKVTYSKKSNEIKTKLKEIAPLVARAGLFAVSFDIDNQTASKASKLSITSEMVDKTKALAGLMLNQAQAQKVQKASNNQVKKAVAIAICKNAKLHYRKLAKCSDQAIYTQQQSVAVWATLNQAYFEILSNFGAYAILQKLNGDIEFITSTQLAGVVEKITTKANQEKANRKQAKANDKEKATAKAVAKASKTAKASKPKAKK